MRCSILICGLTGLLIITSVTTVRSATAGGAVPLSGTATWDVDLVREYMQKEYMLNLSPQPAPWRNQAMAAHLNQEFVKRLNSLMSIYQALGGDTNLGIESPKGGLRSAQDQIELFKKCRRIKLGMNMQPVGDGSNEADWEEIPRAERSGEGVVSSQTTSLGATETIEKLGPSIEDCGVSWSKKMPNGDVVQCTVGTITEAWVSWHNLGLAADLTEVLVDKKGKIYQNGLASNDAWKKLTTIFGELGLTWGGWWGWDPDHVEFHPQMASPRNIGQSGQPLPDNQLRTGYKWKIPSTIFTYAVDMTNPRANALWVFDLKDDGGIISVKDCRRIVGQQDGPWSGEWMTFDPAIRLFPAYIPTIKLLRNSARWPQDSKWDSDTKVEVYNYDEKFDSNGKKFREWSHTTGQAHYLLDMNMRNRQYEANVAYGQSFKLKDTNKVEYDRIRQLWRYLNRTSVYDIDVNVQHPNMSAATVQQRRVDVDGYTEDSSTTPKIWLTIPHLGFAWDRDKGEVGAGPVTDVPQEGAYILTDHIMKQRRALSTVYVSYRPPPGAWDLPQPVPEPPANPRPKDQKKPQGHGWLPP